MYSFERALGSAKFVAYIWLMSAFTLPNGKQRLALPGETNGDPIDKFTLAHFAWGLGFGSVGAPWWVALGSALLWDIFVERALKDAHPEWFPVASQDTAEHIAVDAAAWMLGWGAVRTMARRR